MLTITAQRVAKGGQAIDIQVFITALQGSPGIESANVTAIDLSSLDKEMPQGCPGHLSFFVKAIPLAALPLYIEATECPAGVDQGQAVGVKTTVGPLFGEEIGLVECNPQGGNQNNRVCTDLQNQIQLLRNKILTECGEAAGIKSQRDTAALAAAAAGAVALGLAAVAAATPWPFNLILAILAALAFAAAEIAAGFVIRYQRQLNDLSDQMTKDRIDLSTLIERLSDVCCPEFIKVSLDVPLCPS